MKCNSLTPEQQAEAVVEDWLAAYQPDLGPSATQGLIDRIRNALETSGAYNRANGV